MRATRSHFNEKNGGVLMRAAQRFTVACLLTSLVFPAMAAYPLFDTEPLTAERLVQTVLERNPGLAALRAAVTEAASRVEPAGALEDPMLAYNLAPQTLGGGRLSQAVELSQEIPWPGTLGLREDAAYREAEATSLGLADLRLEIIAAVKTGFAEWYYVHRALAINEANRDLLIELRNVAETQYSVGRATQQDVIQAELEHAQLLDDALRLKREQGSIQAQLNGLLNRAPGEYLAPPAEIATPDLPPDLRVLRYTAIEAHPGLKQAEALLQASRSRVGLAEKDFYPDFGLNIGYDGFWDDEDQRFSVGASINIPLNRSKYRDLVDAAQADALQAQWRLAERRAQLLAAVGRSRAEVAESVDVIALHHDQLEPLAQDNVSAATADYRAGAGDFLDVITAENRKLMIELSLARAQANYVRRLAELERWTGGNVPAQPSMYEEGEVDD
jgi:cobalt-zinc-cadmium efflux system outer membrane protein